MTATEATTGTTGTTGTTTPRRPPAQFPWLVESFAEKVPGVAHAAVVPAGRLLLASSSRLPPDRADQLAAVASGITSPTRGAAQCFDVDLIAFAATQLVDRVGRTPTPGSRRQLQDVLGR